MAAFLSVKDSSNNTAVIKAEILFHYEIVSPKIIKMPPCITQRLSTIRKQSFAYISAMVACRKSQVAEPFCGGYAFGQGAFINVTLFGAFSTYSPKRLCIINYITGGQSGITRHNIYCSNKYRLGLVAPTIPTSSGT